MVYAIIDDTGLGGGVTDILRHEREARGLNQLEVIPVNFGASVPQEDAAANYADISTWMWSLVRDMAQSGRLHLPNDTELIAQLSTRKYAFAGTPPKLKLESKDIMKRRGLPSLTGRMPWRCPCISPSPTHGKSDRRKQQKHGSIWIRTAQCRWAAVQWRERQRYAAPVHYAA